MLKIYLIYFDLNAGYIGFHHGLAYLIGMLRSLGHDVYLVHLTAVDEFETAFQTVNDAGADIVGLSFTTNQKKYARQFLNLGKIKTKLIIAGGVHASFLKDTFFDEFPDIMGICVGEAESPMKELCFRLEHNQDYLTTPSFYFKTNSGILRNQILPLKLIEELPLPDYSLFDVKRIVGDADGLFDMMLSRGCPYNCSYCCNHILRENYPNRAQYVRFPPVDYALKIIRNNLKLYPHPKELYFADDMFTLNKNWIADFCSQYQKEIHIPFQCNARLETMDKDIVRMLKNAGCTLITFGIESGNNWIRQRVLNRHYSNEKVKEVFKLLRSAEIKTHAFNIFGLPFETSEMARDTFKLNWETAPDSGRSFYFYPYPNTRSHQICVEYHLIDEQAFAQVSGYLEQPILKEIHMNHAEVRKWVELLQIFFYARVFFSKFHLPLYLQKILIRSLLMFRKPIMNFLQSSHPGIKRLRKIMH